MVVRDCQSAQVEDRLCTFGQGGEGEHRVGGKNSFELQCLLLTKSRVVRDFESVKVEDGAV